MIGYYKDILSTARQIVFVMLRAHPQYFVEKPQIPVLESSLHISIFLDQFTELLPLMHG